MGNQQRFTPVRRNVGVQVTHTITMPSFKLTNWAPGETDHLTVHHILLHNTLKHNQSKTILKLGKRIENGAPSNFCFVGSCATYAREFNSQ